MKIAEEIPTKFATLLAEKCGLMLPMQPGTDYAKASDLKEKMQWFQQMSVTCKFEECVQVYFGQKLTDEQIAILKLIHRSTKPWITGHIVGVLMSRIESDKMQNRDFAEAVRVLVEQAGVDDGQISSKMQGILVKSTRRDGR